MVTSHGDAGFWLLPKRRKKKEKLYIYIHIYIYIYILYIYQFLRIYKYILITRDEFLMTYRFLLKTD